MNPPLHKLQRARASQLLRRFCPDYRAVRISDVDPKTLLDAGVKAVLLDLDNTLLPWKGHELPQESIDWVKKCLAAGLQLCLVSNTRNRPRLLKLSELLGVPFVVGKMKPSKEMFKHALKMLDAKPAETVMVGDQMFTDIWGGNRMGIRTIWVEPIAKREFFGTKISRVAERIVKRALRKAEDIS